MKTYGYARVSAKDQNLARQTESFLQFGIPQQNIFSEKKSGKDFCRTEYLRLTDVLEKSDLLVIHSLDRLGRNYDQIIAEWRRLTQEIGADVVVLDMPLLDTRSRPDTLLGKFVSDLVLEVLSFVAENERTNIRARQAEGIRLAKERGVKFGRPKITLDEQFERVAKQYSKYPPLKWGLWKALKGKVTGAALKRRTKLAYRTQASRALYSFLLILFLLLSIHCLKGS